MEEKKNSIRLSKAIKEFNIGLSTAIEFLRKKGHTIEEKLTTRLTEEQYDLLSAAFQGERNVKVEADKIEISANKKNVVAASTSFGDASNDADSEELTIKNYPIAAPTNEVRKTAVQDTPAPSVSISAPTEEPAEAPAEEPTPTVAEAPEPEKPVFETQVIKASVAGSKQGSEAYNAELKIVNKIDLDAINTRTHPEKAKKDKKSKKNKQEKPAAPAPQQTVAAEKPVEKPAPQPEKAVEPAAPPAPVKEQKDENFVETQYQKLEGPKVVAKIDLSQFEQPKSEHRKRKHVKKEGVKVDVNDVKNQAKSNKGNGKNGQAQGQPQGQQGQGQDKKSDKNARKKDKNKKKAPEKKPEVDDAEIEKQIRETLARLSPTGKSKTSKHNREKRQRVQQQMEQAQEQRMEQQNVLQVTEFVTANELASMMNTPVNKIIGTCMSVGIFVSINQRLDAETIQLIADEFGYKVNFVSTDVAEALNAIEEEDHPEDLVTRNPIVTVMGHVDHGKTSLLDYIRKTNVIAGEAGGITQHIGAYEVTMQDGRKITFLDTPGHEAFTAMRARGAKVTDIVIIVIAADDKIMPQTIEAINHAQAAACPIVFAINKIDKPGADPDRIKTELANMNLLVEEWGGKYQSQDISAKQGINVEQLLEKVLLQAEIMELKGNPNKRAKGTVIESSLDKGRGYVSKILVHDGTIRQGDHILAGSIYGKVKAMYNERNVLVKEAGPSQPVLLLGLQGAPQAGDTFNVTETEKEAKDLANKRLQLQREQGLRTQKHITLDEIGRRIAIGDFKELNLIVKADVDGTVEALSDSLLKLSNEEVQVNVVHKAVGQITESDVLLAEASNAVIIGFQVRPSVQARKLAENEQIDIRLYSIIYDAINELKDAIEGMLSPETQTKITANLEIRETFKISKVGTIAGCMCLDGKINRNSNVRIIRDGIVVYTGKLASLKRFKDDVKEVVSGQDCGLNIENFNDIKVGDIVEAYEIIEIKKKL